MCGHECIDAFPATRIHAQFGDLNNENSKLSQLLKVTKDEKRPNGIDKKIGNPRAYRVLEEIGVKPNIFYLTKIRNREAGLNENV